MSASQLITNECVDITSQRLKELPLRHIRTRSTSKEWNSEISAQSCSNIVIAVHSSMVVYISEVPEKMRKYCTDIKTNRKHDDVVRRADE